MSMFEPGLGTYGMSERGSMNSSDSMLRSLFDAIVRKRDLVVHFQPIVCLTSQSIYGYEGLIRGPADTLFHSPAMLFGAATRFGCLAQLDYLCRELVVVQFARLNLSGRLFVNVSPVSILHENFREGKTMEWVKKCGINTSRVVIELTETHPVDDMPLMQKALSYYRDMGFRVALDDLGTGYSGLKLWSEIKPDFVKVDRHFIQGVDESRIKQQFLGNIIATATAMGCKIITEGVETEGEYATLRKLGVGLVQGYYFSRPKLVPPSEIPGTLFRSDVRSDEESDSPSVNILLRPAISIDAATKVLTVGEMFTETPDVESMVVVHDGEVLGMVLKKEFMNMYASLYGKELYGKEPVLKFMNRNVLQVERSLSLEEVSYRLTTSLDLYTGEFILLDGCELAGKARLVDLLYAITRLKVNRARHANPLTLLPGNVPIHKQLQKLFRQRNPVTICYFDLDNFKPFNDLFGFSTGDEVIMLVADLLKNTIDVKKNFVGHIGGDDFVVVFKEDRWQEKVHDILQQFDARISDYYNGRMVDEKLIITDRQGKFCSYDRMGLSVGAVVIKDPEGLEHIDLSEEAAIAKHHAKCRQGSFLYTHQPLPEKQIAE